MVDVAEPDETFSAARYAREARRCAEEVYARGRLPLVVGGSGLYIRALVEGLFEGPGAQPGLRRRLEEEADRGGADSLHRRLAACDPETAARVHPNDRKRVIRALEVFATTGRPISALRSESGGGGFARPLYLGVDWPSGLHARHIEERVRGMLKGGMPDEAAALAEAGLTEAAAFEGLGYAEALAFHRGEADFETTVARIIRLHRSYAKRQRTWFRKMKNIRWLPGDAEARAEEAAAALWAYVEGSPSFLGVRGGMRS